MGNNFVMLKMVGHSLVKPRIIFYKGGTRPVVRVTGQGSPEYGKVEVAFFRAVLPSLALACEAAIDIEKVLALRGVDPKYLYFSKAASDCGDLLFICFVTLLASSKNIVSVPALHAAFLTEVVQYVVCSPSFKDIVPIDSPMHTPHSAVLTIFFSTLQTNLIKFLPGNLFHLEPQGEVSKEMLLINEFSPDCIVVNPEVFFSATRGVLVNMPSLEAPQPWESSMEDRRFFKETYCSVSGNKITVSLRDGESSFFASPGSVAVKVINTLESNSMYFSVREAELVFFSVIDLVWNPFYVPSCDVTPTEDQVRDCVNAGFGMPGGVENVERWLLLLPEYRGKDLGKEAEKLYQEFYRTVVLLEAIVFLDGKPVYREYRVDGSEGYVILGFISITESKLAGTLCRLGFHLSI